MSNQEPAPQVFTESGYEVRFASFRESDLRDAETSSLAFYERLADLEIGSGVHFLRAGSLDKNVDMLVQDYPENDHVREAVIMFGSLVHYYAFDLASGDIMHIRKDLPMNRKGQVLQTAQTPLYVTERDEQCTEVVRCVGEQYQRWLGNRVVGLRLLSEESSEAAFMEDTAVFLKDTRMHSEPTVYDHLTGSPQAK